MSKQGAALTRLSDLLFLALSLGGQRAIMPCSHQVSFQQQGFSLAM